MVIHWKRGSRRLFIVLSVLWIVFSLAVYIDWGNRNVPQSNWWDDLPSVSEQEIEQPASLDGPWNKYKKDSIQEAPHESKEPKAESHRIKNLLKRIQENIAFILTPVVAFWFIYFAFWWILAGFKPRE